MIEALEKLKELGFTILETRMMALSKVRRKDGDWCEIKLHVHPDDMPNELFKVDLGTRLYVAMVQIGEDEQPVEKPRREWHELSPVEQAGILCTKTDFQEWCRLEAATKATGLFDGNMAGENLAAQWIYRECNVTSRRDLAKNPVAKHCWSVMLAKFEEDTRLPERH